MIEILTGSPGAGKSYAGVRRLVQAVRKGTPVVTNIPLRPGWAETLARAPIRSSQREAALAAEYRRLLFSDRDMEVLLRVRLRGEGEGRGLMILDEAQQWLDSRTWDTQVGQSRDEAIRGRQALNKRFQEHRHFGFNILLLTQHIQNIDARVVRLFEYHTHTRNLRRVRVLGVPICPVNLFVANTTWNDRVKSRVGSQIYTLEKSVAGLYHTHALADYALEDDSILHPADAPTRP